MVETVNAEVSEAAAVPEQVCMLMAGYKEMFTNFCVNDLNRFFAFLQWLEISGMSEVHKRNVIYAQFHYQNNC